MNGIVKAMAATLMLAVGAGQALGQGTVRVRGTIASVDGLVLVVKGTDGRDVKVKLADNVTVFAQSKGTLSDITVGKFVGVGGMPQSDGRQLAIQVVIFPESLRGAGEGFRPWDRPNSTMTNATVESSVLAVDRQELLLRYKGGEQRIVVTPEANIINFTPGDRAELKPGAAIAINAAAPQPDGSFTAARLNVGRDGFVP